MAVPRGSERVVVATMGAVRSVAVGAAVWMAAVQEAVVVEGTFSGAVGLATVATESAVEGSATVVAGSGVVAEALPVAAGAAVAAATAMEVVVTVAVVGGWAAVGWVVVEVAMAVVVVVVTVVVAVAILVARLRRQADQRGRTGQQTECCDHFRWGPARSM